MKLMFWIQGEGDHNAKLGITILGKTQTSRFDVAFHIFFWVKISFLELTSYLKTGEAVDVEDEVVVVNSIVLPNKTLNVSVQEEIIL